jgi:hypothetical protein
VSAQDGVPGLVWSPLRRHWRWVLGLTAALGLTLTLLLDGTSTHRYSLTETYLVTAAAPATGAAATDAALVSANTDRAARDYAVVLRSDDRLLAALASTTDRSPEQVRAALRTGYRPASSTIEVSYHAAQAAQVRALFAELDRLVASDSIGSSNFAPGLVRPLHADRPLSSTTLIAGVHPGVGLVGGLLVGLLAALLLSRGRPRVANRLQLQVLTDRPVLVLDGTPEALEALAVRALGCGSERVCVVATDPEPRAAELRDALARLSDAPPVVVASTVVAPERGETAVLVTAVGEPLRRLESRLSELDEYADVLVALVDGEPLPVGARTELVPA